MAGTARRDRDARLVSRCRVEFDRPSGAVAAETEDLSARGLFIRTEELLPMDEETEIRLVLPDGELLVFRARVAHMLTPSSARALGRHAGMGFELLGSDSAARLKLRSHVEALRNEITSPGLSTTTQILVVEPSAPLRARMTRSLEVAGFKVTQVTSVSEALQACAVWRPDAIVCAAALDGMTGIDLAYAMSEHATQSDVPILLNGDDADLGRLEAFRAGVRDYIPRPFLDEELVIRTHRVAAPAAAATNPGLRGALKDLSLGTLLSLFEFERKSGVLLMLHEGYVARVFVSEGRVLKVEASRGGITLRERLMRLLDWHTGHFEFSPCAVGGRDEIGVAVTQLLLEHAQRSDEAAAR
ncbi:MAG: DUF4388 domain-containing protein [Proteobacteria bacterium]|nr:DUF4388 domain-containing protein [Pseudomonadota bacterium]